MTAFKPVKDYTNVKQKAAAIFLAIFMYAVILASTGYVLASARIFGLNIYYAEIGGDYPGTYGESMVKADFNSDGNLDLAMTSFGWNPWGKTFLYFGRGDGSFSVSSTNYGQYYTNPRSITTADYNGDSIPDLAIIYDSYSGDQLATDTLSILLGIGDGSFRTPTEYSLGPSHPYAITSADFNGDNKQDLAIAKNASNTVALFLGNGDGTFGTSTNFAVSSSPRSVFSDDFNGDGKNDLAVANGGSNNVTVLLGAGDGTFPTSTPYRASSTPYYVISDDFNGDNKKDLAVANYDSKNVSILLGNGDGTFASSTPFDVSVTLSSIVSDDFNGDNKQDLAVAAGNVKVYYGAGDGTFVLNNVYINYTAAELVTGDFNGDLAIDLAAASMTDFGGYAAARIFLNDGSGILGSHNYYPFYPPYTGVTAVANADFNEDGKLDLIADYYSTSTVAVLLGNGDNSFATPTYYSYSGSSVIITTDVDGDGHQDAVFRAANKIDVLFGVGNGTFSTTTHYAVSNTPTGLAVVDLNGDGAKDMAISHYDSNNVSVLFQIASGTFGSAVDYDVGTSTSFLSTADFNNDNKIDIVAGAYRTSNVFVLLQDATGTFASAVSYSAGSDDDVQTIVTHDFNDDGNQDLVTGNDSMYGVSVLLGNGDGTFATATAYYYRPSDSFSMADFNGDGRDDLTMEYGYEGFSILFGNGDGTFAIPSSWPDYWVVDYLHSFSAGDFNNDGKPDLAMSFYFDRGLLIFSNIFTTSSVTFTEIGTSTLVAEGGTTDSYSVVLEGIPSADVIVSVTPSTTWVNTDKSSLTFTTSTWNIPQIVTVTAVDDNKVGNRFSAIVHSVSSADANFNNLKVPNIITGIIQNDTAGVTVSESGGSTNITEGGASDSYTVVLTSQPTANVNIAVTASTTQVTTSLFNLTFTSSNWNTPQTVTVSAIDDVLIEDSHTSTITHTATSTDINYFGLSVSSVTATITDNDTYGSVTSTVYGDFNGDGHQDLAISKGSSNIVSILLGVGDGTFGTATNYTVSSSPAALTTGDFNGDSKTDLAVANSGSNNISILLGVGNGTFGSSVTYSVSSSPYSVTTGDFNGDSKTDLAVANYGSDNVSVLFGVGNGTFGTATNYNVNNKPISITSADFNSDSKYDLAVANFNSSTVSILLNSNTTGTFSNAVNYSVGNSALPYSLTTYDFNSDNLYDIVTANSASNTVSVLLNAGSGTFTLQNTTYAVGASPRSITNYDFNGDGKRDLITSNYSANTISTLFGTGIGTFATSTAYSLGTKPLTVITTDFSGDFWPDIVVADASDDSYSILTGNRGGLFSSSLFADAVSYNTGIDTPLGAAIGDFDEDGNQDLAVANVGTTDVAIYLGAGDGTFTYSDSYPTGGGGPGTVAVADFDKDGNLDLATANYGGGTTMSIFLGNGDGTFDTAVDYATAGVPVFIDTADFNNDTYSDVVVSGGEGTDVSVFLNDGDGTFADVAAVSIGLYSYGITAADFNNDNYIDLATGNAAAASVSVALNDGDGTFGTAADYSVGQASGGITSGDFNGDGYIDLASANYGGGSGNTASVLLNDGDGTFGSAVAYTVGTAPLGIVSDDFDEDGNLDLAVANLNGYTSILLGLGDGTFGSATNYSSGAYSINLASGDLNGDAKPDLAVVNYLSNSMSILLNTHTTGAGVTISQKASTNVWEDGMTDTFSIVLDAQPSANVIITPSSPTSTQMVFYPSTLTFTSTTWYTAQTVTMAANGSTLTSDHNVTVSNTASSSDSGYEGIAIASIPVTIHKNGGGGPSVMFPISSGGTAIISTSTLSSTTLFNLFSTSTNQQNNNNNTNTSQTTTTTSTPITTITSVLSDLSHLILSTIFGRNLYIGNIGYDVKILQNILSNIPGIYPQKLKTGYYGNLTKNAVNNYQKQIDTISSSTPGYGQGIFGPRTRGYLTKTYQLPTSSPKYLFTRSLQLGSTGTDVKVLQTILAQDKTIYPEGKITGYFNLATKKAVQRFQLKYKITTPSIYGYGIFGPKTRAKIGEMMR